MIKLRYQQGILPVMLFMILVTGCIPLTGTLSIPSTPTANVSPAGTQSTNSSPAATEGALSQPSKTTQEIILPEFMLAFTTGGEEPTDHTDLNIIGMDGEGLKNLSKEHNLDFPRHPTWSPDGSKVAFIDCQETTGFPTINPAKHNTLYMISPDGAYLTSLEQIMTTMNINPGCSLVSWSPDSQWIAFEGSCLTCPPYFRDIFIISVGGDVVKNLTEDFDYQGAGGCAGLENPTYKACQQERIKEYLPVWSPDGRYLAMAIAGEIYVVSAFGSDYRKLTDQEGEPILLNWTPDSKYIVYENQENSALIYAVSVDNGELRLVTEGSGPNLSPDGTLLAFYRGSGIYVMDFNGQYQDHIVSTTAGMPVWSPDGNFIAYQMYTGRNQSLWVTSKDGSWRNELHEIHSWYGEYPSWSK